MSKLDVIENIQDLLLISVKENTYEEGDEEEEDEK